MKRRVKNNKNFKEEETEDETWAPTQEETNVAIHLYDNLKNREGRVSGMVFGIFKGEEAYRCLAASRWSTLEDSVRKPNSKQPLLFQNREEVLEYLTQMMQKGMFHKAKRIQKKQKEKKMEELEDQHKLNGVELVDETKHKKKKKEVEVSPFALPKKKMPKLEIVQEYTTFTTDEPMTYYVWAFDRPPTLKTWILGILLLMAMIFCCFFPIWPSFLRSIAYYSAMSAMIFIGFILVLGVFRWILYIFCYIGTAGRCSFWLFPNLFGDCGFFDSFKPVTVIEWASCDLKIKLE